MPYKMTVNIESSVPGEVFQIAGLGEFENGETYLISDEENEAFRTYHSKQVTRTDKKGNMSVKTILGPSLDKTSETMHGISVVVEKPTGGNQ